MNLLIYCTGQSWLQLTDTPSNLSFKPLFVGSGVCVCLFVSPICPSWVLGWMSLSAASRHPVRQTIKTPLCVQSLWMRMQWSRTIYRIGHSHTLCVSTYWCHTNSVTQSSDNRWNVLSLILSTPFSRSKHHIWTRRGKHLSVATPLLSEVLPFTHFHIRCPTLLWTSIYYLRLSAVLSEKSVSPARAEPLLLSVASHLPAHSIPGPPSHTQSFSLSSLLLICWKPGSISPHPYGMPVSPFLQ